MLLPLLMHFNLPLFIFSVFCPKCGNQTLKKVAVSLNEDGTLQIHISSRKKLTARGKKVNTAFVIKL
jgi:hypothetical protein